MKRVVTLTVMAVLGSAGAQLDEGTASLRGAGSTLAAPLMQVWAKQYQQYRLGGVDIPVAGSGLDDTMTRRALDYEAVGSAAGLERLKAGQRDFAVSEKPMSSAELRRAKLRQIPLVISGIAIVTNLPGEPKLKLTGGVLADIYLGKVKTWNDAAIAKLNPGIKLPSQVIRPVFRTEGSGSTYAFSGYLSAVSDPWKRQVGQNIALKWPAGTGVRGSNGMRDLVKRTPYSIGYLSDVQAESARLNVVGMVNRAGQTVWPNQASLNAATVAVTWRPGNDFAESLVNAAGKGSYPISTAVYFLYPDGSRGATHRRSVAFAQWAMRHGGPSAQRLGYLTLPAAKSSVIEEYLRQ